ncbi:MAG: hypothetical protein ACOYO0_04220 [Sandarakinorhabdus sp.]
MHFAPNSRPVSRVAVLALLACAAGVLVWIGWPDPPEDGLDVAGGRYVELAMRGLGPDEIDAYFGPAIAPDRPPPPAVLRSQVKALAADLRAAQAQAPIERRARLLARTEQLDALLGLIAAPRSLGFDAEAAAIFGIAPAHIDTAAQAAARQSLAALLPGPGALAQRVMAYRRRFALPPDKRKAVFARALAECRARTLARWPLPAQEHVEIEWTARVPAAWHRYLGDYQSRLQINPAAVADPAVALDLACHEAYPGHHAQFVLLEARNAAIWREDRVVLVRSPQSALREGSANHGIDLAFPPAERLAFMAGSLFPLAGFSPADARLHGRVHQLIGTLALSTVPILRRYRDGGSSREQTLAALADEALISSPEALLAFFDRYGTLVAGYSVARQRVARCVDASRDRWAALRELVANVDTRPLGQAEDASPCKT